MLTSVVAKQAKTTKFKSKFVNEIKSSKEYSVAFLVEGEKFNFGEKFKFASSVLFELGRYTA